MDEGKKVPMLLEFLFGEEAKTAQRGASERQLHWAHAFDEWMAERGKIYKPGATKQAKLAFQRLFRNQRMMLWELKQEDIEQHRDWMAAEGYAASTIYNDLGMITNFYQVVRRTKDRSWIVKPGLQPGGGG